MKQTSASNCFLCEASCGLLVEHDDARVFSVRGDPEDQFSRGYICPKGVALQDIQHDPDRLRKPLRKTTSGWQEVSWGDALDEVARRLAGIQNAHGRDAVAIYTGNPFIHNHEVVLFSQFLLQAVGTRNHFSANSVDGLPRLLASYLMYGAQTILPIPDIDHTQHILIIGANPVVSNGSIMTAPDCKRRLKAIRQRGGRVVVIDPRRTETAALADEHHFVHPGSDALLLLAMLQTLFAEGLTRGKALRPMLDGWQDVERVVREYTPAKVAIAVGIEARTIERLARDFAGASSAVCYGRMGTSTQRFGTITSWLVDVLNIVTGNFDRRGGAMFPKGAVDLPALAARLGQKGSFGRFRSRVSHLPEFSGELPAAAFAEEMETAGTGQIRALITSAGNPILSLPNGRRLDRAFEKLEFMVSVDIYLNETTRHADLILPPTWGLEHDYYPLIFGALSVRNRAKFSPALLEPAADTRAEWQILLDLATGIQVHRDGRLAGFKAKLLAKAAGRLGPRGVLALALRLGPYHEITLRELERAPHGIDLGPLSPRLSEVIATESGRVQLAPPQIIADLPRVRELLTPAKLDELALIGRRDLRSNNSWMHNSQRLIKGKDRCVLLMHPDDAGPRHIGSGDHARITTNTGSIEAPVALTDQVMKGVVSLPHGWGHDREGVRLRVASEHPGVSLNDVTDDAAIDPLSGVIHFNGVPARVERVAKVIALEPSNSPPMEAAD